MTFFTRCRVDFEEIVISILCFLSISRCPVHTNLLKCFNSTSSLPAKRFLRLVLMKSPLRSMMALLVSILLLIRYSLVSEPTAFSSAYTCTVCNKTKTETIEATGHDWNETTTPATCGKAGSVDRTCKTCGTTEHVKDLPATGNHVWDAGTITTEATCDGKGVKTFTCTVCNETKTEEIAALGHDFAYGYCSRCDLNANYNQKEWEQDIFEQTNGLRAKYNLGTLTYRDDLQYAADMRVEELVQNYVTYGDYGGKWGNPHVRPDGSGAATALGGKQDLACGENAANDAGIFGKGHMFYLWTQSEGHLAAIMNPDADGMVCALKEYNGRVFGIQIFVRDPDYNMDTQSAASDTSAPVEIAAVVVTDSATTETAAE